ncbi:MAG TPA: helix-turn-helix transcriptional regulator [Cryomorphaceae bacterium]|nr:helix-turn-helix transcriptional regulator [Cryomorphaceae bacterium]
MPENIIHIESISQLHSILGIPKPKHPLISLIDASQTKIDEDQVNTRIVCDFYMISMKDKSCGMEYGRKTFDFDEGVMAFSSPGQVYTATREFGYGEIQGWLLYFHPDLIRASALASQMDDYSFFKYEVAEALHLSEDEEQTMNEIVQLIEKEYNQRIDNHSQRVIVSNIQLLLNYSLRFYERQFNTRVHQSKDIVAQFESALADYFRSKKHMESGLPTIRYFADKANLSTHYFSDLLKKETGRKPKDHINDFVVEKAKNLILGTEMNINEIAYDLGFNYPHYFTRLFKSKTGKTPIEYRTLN